MSKPQQSQPGLLYIHPYNHEAWHVIPVGVIGMMNQYTGQARGVYAHEATRELIRNADIVLLGVHWFFPLANIGAMAREIKEANEHATVVVGGYTAGLYAKELLDEHPEIDFIIAGDGENALKRIILWKQDNSTYMDVPGIVRRDSHRVEFCSDTTETEFSEQDFITLDWFPGLHSLSLSVQENFRCFDPSRGYDGNIFPQIPVIRGCFTPCQSCYGNADFQRSCGRSTQLVRTAQSVAADLDRCEADSGIHAVNLIGDFLTMANEEYSQFVLSRKRELVCYYAFCAGTPPDKAQLHLLLNAFKYCFLIFIMDYVPGARFENQLRTLTSTIREAPDRCMAVFYLRGHSDQSHLTDYFKGNVILQAHPEWDMPVPEFADDKDLSRQFRRFRDLSAKFAIVKLLCLLFPEMISFLDYRYFFHTRTEHPGAERLLDAVKSEYFKTGFVAPQALRFMLMQTGAGKTLSGGENLFSVQSWELLFSLNGYRLRLCLAPQNARCEYAGLAKLVFSLEIGGYLFESATCWALKSVSLAIPDSLRKAEGDILEIDLFEGGIPHAARFNGTKIKI